MKYFLKSLRVDLADLILVIAGVILYSPFLFGGKVMFWGTTILQFIPWRHIAVEILRSGELPLWNPYNGMGAPLLANYQTAFLYPATWILMALEAMGGIGWSIGGQAFLILIHLILAGMGMRRWVKELGVRENGQIVSGVVFGLSGYLVSRAHFQSIILSAAWLPWILLFATRIIYKKDLSKKSDFITLVCVMTLQLLGGHAQTTWYSIWVVTIWVLFLAYLRSIKYGLPLMGTTAESLLRWFAGILLSLFLASPQLLPTAEYMLESQRASGVDISTGSVYSFWPWRVLTIFMPNLFGNPGWHNYWGYGNYWEDAIYSGSMAVPISLYVLYNCLKQLIHRKNRQSHEPVHQKMILFWWVVVIVSLVLAFGKNLPIYHLLIKIPGYQLFQAPTRISLLSQIGLAFLAGWGIDRWSKPSGKRLYWLRLSVAGAAAMVISAVIFRWFLYNIYPTISWSILVFGTQALIFGVILLSKPVETEGRFSGVLHVNPSKLWGVVAGLFFAIDMVFMGWGLNPGVDIRLINMRIPEGLLGSIENGGRIYLNQEDEYRLKFEYFFRFDSFGTPMRWNELSESLLPNLNLLVPVAMVNNFDPFVPDRYARYIEAVDEAEQSGNEVLRERLLNLAGVKWVLNIDAGYRENITVRQSYSRFSMVYCVDFVPNKVDVYPELLHTLASENNRAIIENKKLRADSSSCATLQDAPLISTVTDKANHIVVDIATPQDGWFVLADTYYPGWKAKVDGRKAEIYAVNGVFRGVWVEAGKHRVEYYYSPTPFYIGLLFSIIGIGGVAYSFRQKKYAHS